mgnify:CR=1 FL=1
MEQPKKLIEVVMPIKEISAESVRDKSIRSGHISTLHLWWARRPLPACRAIVFASLVPDPLDKNCPQSFKDAVDILLGKVNNSGDPYKPYDDIPYTSAIDKMDDNLRNRLLMFISKYSQKFIINERQGKRTDTKDQISDSSLIKWENRNNEEILNKARKLIWVAHNSSSGNNAKILLSDFEKHFKTIKECEYDLYSTPDRHLSTEKIIKKENNLKNAIETFLAKMPKVFDPFAGGGAIPLEAARLGCSSYGNDINPVAHIIQKGSAEFPQKFGKPIVYSKTEFIKIYGEETWKQQPQQNKIVKNGEVIAVNINNRLAFDFEFFGKKILKETEKEISFLYPKRDKVKSPIAYYWVRFGICSNPTCKAEIPLLKQFYLSKLRNESSKNWIYLEPIIEGNKINFKISKGICDIDGYVHRGNLSCPCCGNITDEKELKSQFINKVTTERIVCEIFNHHNKKEYRIINDDLSSLDIDLQDLIKPTEDLPLDSRITNTTLFGYQKWGELFNARQLKHISTLISKFKQQDFFYVDSEYAKAVATYIAILIDRIIARNTSFGIWHILQETFEHPFGRQAIFMVFDFPEMNPFSDISSSDYNQCNQIIKYLESENDIFPVNCNNTASGDKSQFKEKEITATITDPPYYDAIAYGDISDFFYVWLKKTLGDFFPYNFSTPRTPKSDECTAIKSHHDNDLNKAKEHFENKLKMILSAVEYQTNDIISIMFAHQSTEAWTTLCNSIIESRMNITGSWAIDTEVTGALKSDRAFLSSSVTVCAKPTQRHGFGNYKQIRNTIEEKVTTEVNNLYRLGFRGADLLTACFGQAVSVFGQFERVEKADGSQVSIAELLEMAKEFAFNALLKGFDGDDFTKFYIGWLQLYGFTESDFDDAAKFSRVGLTINVSDLFMHNIFIKRGNKQELASYKDRIASNRRLGDSNHDFIIDNVHKAMAIYSGTNRNELLTYIAKVAVSPESSFWRVITSLCEVLPQGSDDYKQATGLLLNKDSLIRESKNIQQSTGAQGQLF